MVVVVAVESTRRRRRYGVVKQCGISSLKGAESCNTNSIAAQVTHSERFRIQQVTDRGKIDRTAVIVIDPRAPRKPNRIVGVFPRNFMFIMYGDFFSLAKHQTRESILLKDYGIKVLFSEFNGYSLENHFFDYRRQNVVYKSSYTDVSTNDYKLDFFE